MPYWYWAVLGGVFAVIEVAVPAMVCIWLAAAALGVAAISWRYPGLAWEHQALIFAALAVASVVLGRTAVGRTKGEGERAAPKPPSRNLCRANVHIGWCDSGWPRTAQSRRYGLARRWTGPSRWNPSARDRHGKHLVAGRADLTILCVAQFVLEGPDELAYILCCAVQNDPRSRTRLI